MTKKLTHVDDKGKVRMVDISKKPAAQRYARASGTVLISGKLFNKIKQNDLAKGDALATAKIAGIQAAKKTSELIPLCHPLPVNFVSVDLELVEKPPSVEITAEAITDYRTGVEMEALTAVAVAALTIIDMGKSVDKGIIIESIKLLEKRGGRSGSWSRRKADK